MPTRIVPFIESTRNYLRLGAMWIMAVAAVSAVVAGSGCGGGGGRDAAMKEALHLLSTHGRSGVTSDEAEAQELATLIESIVSKCSRSGDDHPWGTSEVADSIEVIMRVRHESDLLQAARAFDSVVPKDPLTTCDLLLNLIIS